MNDTQVTARPWSGACLGSAARNRPVTAASRRITGRHAWMAVLIGLVSAPLSIAAVATFDDLPLEPESHWNGADESGGFASGTVFFSNNYNADWGSWDGFAYSNRTDTGAEGYGAQYNAIAGSGQGGTANYAVAYIGWAEPPTISFPTPQALEGFYVTNSNYAYYSMLNGDAFAKKFGGQTGDDEDWLLLTVTGKDTAGDVVGTVEFYVADFRFADNSQDYILDTWEFVDLSALGRIRTLELTLSSSDVGAFGMNTPAVVAIDTILSDPAAAGNGPYTEAGVNGYIDPATWRHADPTEPDAVLNPIFRGWAAAVHEYAPSDETWSGPWNDPSRALGPATGDNFDIVSLGELGPAEIDRGATPGHITVVFGDPGDPTDGDAIRNDAGHDFAVFENAFMSRITTQAGSVTGKMLAELAYVEVSSNGTDFARFPSVSLTAEAVGAYGTIEVSHVFNLAGKHPNASGICTGTPFDLEGLADHPAVVSGAVDLTHIRYVRLVDVPGSGDFLDEATALTDPYSRPFRSPYRAAHPIYDQWETWGSGGFDLEAIGVLREQEYAADINLDGRVDPFDLALLASAWQSHCGQEDWIGRCDLANPKDGIVDSRDFSVLAAQWRQSEAWRSQFERE